MFELGQHAEFISLATYIETVFTSLCSHQKLDNILRVTAWYVIFVVVYLLHAGRQLVRAL